MSKRKVVSFEEKDSKILEYALRQHGSFSDYIKRLIEQDMRSPKKAVRKPNIYELYLEKR
ncbi:hypothetical protein [Alkalihalobacillus sp. BA299]|uniref:hypothetical protein n=1 Tax=Alkalihalobacillus sp. BA299 TaxID=2815938 RepID=UPI001ADA6F85|nr:hypothetical protein [Alkalihalobacillus sp. BA299]